MKFKRHRIFYCVIYHARTYDIILCNLRYFKFSTYRKRIRTQCDNLSPHNNAKGGECLVKKSQQSCYNSLAGNHL